MASVARYTAPLIDLDTHFVFDDSTASTKFAQTIEVAEKAHVRIGCVFLIFVPTVRQKCFLGSA